MFLPRRGAFKLWFCEHAHRIFFPGSNRGDCIYGVKMPTWDSPMHWRMTIGEKRLVYGRHRIAVGGAAPDFSEADSGPGRLIRAHWKPVDLIRAGRKADSTEEIVFFHEGPPCLEEELIMAHAVGAVFDMTPGAVI